MKNTFRRWAPARIAAIYLAISILWIFWSDKLLFAFAVNIEVYKIFQSIKGIIFVFISSLVIYLLIRQAYKSLERNFSILSESERRFKQLFSSIKDSIVITDLNRRIVDCNESLYDMFGYSVEEVKGMETSSFYNDFKQFEALGALIKDNYGDKPFRQVVDYRKKDGSVFSGDTEIFYMMDNGRVNGVIGLIKDITEIKNIQEEKEKSDKLFNMLTSFAPVGIGIFTSGSKIIYANSYITETFGYTINEIPDLETWYQKVFPDVVLRNKARSDWGVKIEKLRNGIAADPMVYPITCKNGEVKIVEFRTAAENELIFAILTDITEKREAEIALSENNRILRESQKIASIGSYIMDVQTGNWKCTKTLDEIFGISEDYNYTVEGWSELVHPEYREIMLKYFIEEVVGKKLPFNKEYMIVRHSDSAVRWVKGIGRLEFGEDGKPMKMIGTIQDITERKNYEIELVSLKNHLSDLVQKKTEELKDRLAELERFRDATIERELRIKELRDRIVELEQKNGNA